MSPLFEARIHVFPRPETRSPEAHAIHEALSRLGFEAVRSVRVGRTFALGLDAANEDAARTRAEDMARRLLANPVMETFHVEVSMLPDAEIRS